MSFIRKGIQMKIDRMLTIIVMLLNRDRVSAKELSDKFEVSTRTIYRDIDSINLAGIPIISYTGSQGGFAIMDNYKLSHQLLTLDNLCSMLSVLKGFNATLDDRALESSIEKLRSLVPKEQARHLERISDQIILDVTPWGYRAEQKALVGELRRAISTASVVEFSYRNYNTMASKRQVEPMSLVFKGYAWYLFGYCRLREDVRTFKLARIEGLQVQADHFMPRDMCYEDMARDFQASDAPIDITLKFTAQVRSRVEDIFDPGIIEFLDNGDMVVNAQFSGADWYMPLILSFGEHVTVLGPEGVRQEIAGRIGFMYGLYC